MTVSIAHRQQHTVRVLGAVSEPGDYLLPNAHGGTRVLDAIALAGGLREPVDDTVVLRRPLADGGVAVLLPGLKSITNNGTENVSLSDGDVLVVEEGVPPTPLSFAEQMRVTLATPVSISCKGEKVTEVIRRLATKGCRKRSDVVAGCHRYGKAIGVICIGQFDVRI